MIAVIAVTVIMTTLSHTRTLPATPTATLTLSRPPPHHSPSPVVLLSLAVPRLVGDEELCILEATPRPRIQTETQTRALALPVPFVRIVTVAGGFVGELVGEFAAATGGNLRAQHGCRVVVVRATDPKSKLRALGPVQSISHLRRRHCRRLSVRLPLPRLPDDPVVLYAFLTHHL